MERGPIRKNGASFFSKTEVEAYKVGHLRKFLRENEGEDEKKGVKMTLRNEKNTTFEGQKIYFIYP